MMRYLQKLHTILLTTFLAMTVAACTPSVLSTNIGTEELPEITLDNANQVGVSVGNPTKRTSSFSLGEDFFPDFDKSVVMPNPVTESEKRTREEGLEKLYNTLMHYLESDSGPFSGSAFPEAPFRIFSRDLNVLYRSLHPIGQLEQFKDLNNFLIKAIAEEGITEVDEEGVSFDIRTFKIYSTKAVWQVDLKVDENNSDYLRVDFKNKRTDLYQASYVFRADENGRPVEGVFTYVNPMTFRFDELTKKVTMAHDKRLMQVYYEVQDDKSMDLLIVMESYQHKLGFFNPAHIYYKCRPDTGICVGQEVQVTGKPPERRLEKFSTRFSWKQNGTKYCFHNLQFVEGEIVTDAPYLGFAIPMDRSTGELQYNRMHLSVNKCQLEEIPSNSHYFVESDLPSRYEDETETGGTAYELFQGGESTEGFHSILPEDIEPALNAEF